MFLGKFDQNKSWIANTGP